MARPLTQHSTSSTSQLRQPSPSDDSCRDPSDGKGAAVVTMTEQQRLRHGRSRLEALRDASTFLEILLGVNEINPGAMLHDERLFLSAWSVVPPPGKAQNRTDLIKLFKLVKVFFSDTP